MSHYLLDREPQLATLSPSHWTSNWARSQLRDRICALQAARAPAFYSCPAILRRRSRSIDPLLVPVGSYSPVHLQWCGRQFLSRRAAPGPPPTPLFSSRGSLLSACCRSRGWRRTPFKGWLMLCDCHIQSSTASSLWATGAPSLIYWSISLWFLRVCQTSLETSGSIYSSFHCRFLRSSLPLASLEWIHQAVFITDR